MNTAGSFVGELIEKGQNTTKSTISDISNSLSGQIGIKRGGNPQQMGANGSQNQVQPQGELTQGGEPAGVSADELRARTEEVVKDFYAPSDNVVKGPVDQLDTAAKQKLAQARAELQRMHGEAYYEPLISYEKKQAEEEKPAERVERQEKEERWELQQKEDKKPQPFELAARRAMTNAEMRGSTPG